MNILFVYPKFTSEHLSKDIGQLFLLLNRFGNKVTLLTYSVEENKVLEIRGINVVRQNSFLGSRFPMRTIFNFPFLSYILKHRREIDCTFSVFNNTLFMPIFYKLLRRNGIAIIKMDSDGKLYKGRARELKKIAGTLIFFALYSSTDRFFIETPRARRELLSRHHWLGNKLTFVPNGINFENYSLAEESFLSETKLETRFAADDWQTILFVCGSTDIPAKGIDLLIEAFNKIAPDFPKWRVKIVGGIPQDYKERVLKLIQSNGLKPNVLFIGKLSLRKTNIEYQNADIYCFPARYASFGLTILEAMFFGKPVISFDVGVAKYALANGAGCVVKTGDVEQLSRALAALMSNEMLRKEIGERAALRCRRLFDFYKIAMKVDQFLKSIYEERNERPRSGLKIK
jgi:glycosyltransferase involved in cell wall biosynthesis